LKSFVALWVESEGIARKVREKQLVCPSTPEDFGKEFLSKELFNNTVASPILSSPGSNRLLPVPRMKSALQGRLFCEATDIIRNEKEELNRLSQYGFQ
jgi:hypothetical protein